MLFCGAQCIATSFFSMQLQRMPCKTLSIYSLTLPSTWLEICAIQLTNEEFSSLIALPFFTPKEVIYCHLPFCMLQSLTCKQSYLLVLWVYCCCNKGCRGLEYFFSSQLSLISYHPKRDRNMVSCSCVQICHLYCAALLTFAVCAVGNFSSQQGCHGRCYHTSYC